MAHIICFKNNGIDYLQVMESYTVEENGVLKNKKRVKRNLGPLSRFDDGKPDYLTRLRKSFKDGNPLIPELADLVDDTADTDQVTIHFDRRSEEDSKSDPKIMGYFLLDGLYDTLGIYDVFNKHKSLTKIKYDVNGLAKLLIFGRVLCPDSKIKTFKGRKGYLFDVTSSDNLIHVYRALDALNEKADAIQKRMNYKIKNTIGRNTEVCYYDVTNYYFEIDQNDEDILDEAGVVIREGLRKKGPSKEKKSEPIVQMGLFIDDNGIPIAYRLFPGNNIDQTTLRPALKKSIDRLKFGKVIIVADGGLNSDKNIAHILSKGNGYILAKSTKKSTKSIKEWILDENGYEWNEKRTFKVKSKIRKRFILTVLLFIVSLSWVLSICPSPSFAEDTLAEMKAEAPFEETAKLEDAYKGHSPFERMISGLFTAVSQSLYTMLGLRDPLELIFDYEPMVKVGYQSRGELYLGIFSDSEASMVAGIYAKLIKYAPIFLVMVVAGLGLYLMIYGAIGDMRMEGKQILTGILVGVIALAVGPHLMDVCFSAMYAGVEIFKDMIEQAVQAKGVATPKSLIGVLLSGMMTQYADMPVDQMAEALTAHVSSLGYAIVLFIVFLSAGIINWQYFMRKLTLALLIILFPPAAMVSVLPSHRQVLQTWFVEFITAASLVLVHAVVYSFLILLTLSIGRPFGFFEILIYSLGLVTASTYVRQLFVGGREGAFRAAAGTAGLRAILGTLALKDAGKAPKQLPRGDSSGPPPNRPGGSPGPTGSSPKGWLFSLIFQSILR